jgi:PAS domain S-box-containing protein
MPSAVARDGAERGASMLARQHALAVEAEAKVAGATIAIRGRGANLAAAPLPQSIIHCVARPEVLRPDPERQACDAGRQASDARFRTLMDAADAFFLQDEDGRVLDVNRQACFSLGYARHELIGKTPFDIDPDADETLGQSVRDHLEAGQTATSESRHRRKDGTLFPVEVRVYAFREGDRMFRVSVVRDISERKQAEATRVRLEEELRQSQKMAVIGTLASGIAHDFNNILGAILGYGELAQGRAMDGRSIEDELDQVMQAGQRGKRLVDHILAFSRCAVAERVPVHVQSVVDEVLRLLAGSLPVGVQLARNLRAGDTALLGDATQLHQVAMNLCTNAIQAMPHGGVMSVRLDRVTTRKPRTLSHGRLQPGEHVRLRVSDTGAGISRAVQGRIFDPFFTTKGVGKGTGLGLSLVHGIVTDWQGAVELESRDGHGATFSIWVPACGETTPPRRHEDAELPRGTGQSVLVVDDELPLMRLAEETLAQLGYAPSGFQSSRAALDAFAADPDRYDLVLTDETMPELTGTRLAREIRKLRSDVPVMLMSGHPGAKLTAGARAAGIAGILPKPLLSRDIAESLVRVLRQRDVRALQP